MNNINKPRKIDWKKKGLGWIPDYPDIRDCRTNQDKLIRKNGFVKKDELTGVVEEITGKLVEVLNILKNIEVSAPINDNNIEELVGSLQDKIFGNLSFITVKVRKNLRKGLPISKSSSFNPELTPVKEHQILELKKYLYILVQNGLDKEVLKSPPFDGDERAIDLKEPKELVKWLRTDDFDETTKRLLMVFQSFADIKIDGILGLETYTALNEYFNAEASTLQDLKSKSEPNKINEILNGEISVPAETKVELVSLPSMIPTEIFKLILDKLIKSNVVKGEFYDDTFSIKNLPGSFKKDFDTIIKELAEFEWKKVFTQEKLQNFIDIAQNNFLFIEPIVSILINITTPLAQFKTLEVAIDLGFKQLEKLIEPFQPFTEESLSNPTTNRLEDSNEYTLSKVDVKTLDQLVQKIDERYYHYLNLLLRDRKKLKDIKKLETNASEIYFYFLVKKYYMGLNITVKQEEALGETNITAKQEEALGETNITAKQEEALGETNITAKQEEALGETNITAKQEEALGETNITAKQEEALGETNIFTKQELLEIDNLDKNDGEKIFDIFPADSIQVPIIKSLYFENSVNCNPKLKHYLFLPSVVDLSYWCSAIEDQGSLNSCSAFAAIALIEYFANKSQGKYIDVSPMFLYKAARNLMNVTGDVGASLRETMKAIALFGVPPEEFWKYEEDRVEDEPPAFCYSYAQNYQALKYFRLDYAGISKETLLFQIKAVLAAGFPCMFGCTIYSSAYDDSNIINGYIPFPDAERDQVVGGHAVVAVGYDDFKEIPQADSKSIPPGALLIRNSWGREWGCQGYGWLPYKYVLEGLTRDWWSLLKTEWFESDNFGFGARNLGVDGVNPRQGNHKTAIVPKKPAIVPKKPAIVPRKPPNQPRN